MSSEIMTLLCKTMKIKPPAGKPDQDFLAKLAGSVEKAPDDTWDSLAESAVGIKAQKWVNAYSDRKDGDKSPIKMFPDWKDGKSAKKDDDMSTDTKKKPAKKAAASAPAKKPAKKAAAAPAKKAVKKTAKKKAAASEGGGGKSSRSFVKELVAKHPNISVEEIEKKLTDKGYELSRLTISTFRNDMRNAMKILLKFDMLKGAFDFD